MRDRLNKWIANFLVDRQHEVVQERAQIGITQGTVLGPLLFLVYNVLIWNCIADKLGLVARKTNTNLRHTLNSKKLYAIEKMEPLLKSGEEFIFLFTMRLKFSSFF